MEPEQPMLNRKDQQPGCARRGFTLLEILVVIGIIILLVAIGVIAFGALDQSPKVTKTTLANLNSMLAELQAMTDLRDEPNTIWRGNNSQSTANNAASLWREPAVVLKNPSAPASTDSDGDVRSGQPSRYGWGAVANTQLVLRFLTRVPANKQLLAQLPSKQVLGTIGVSENKGDLLPAGSPRIIDPPLVLDAWNNPVIFVGVDGLCGVVFESRSSGATPPPQFRVTSAGIFPFSGNPLDTTGLPKTRRPFFASAGPDGEFATGDNNQYSFEQ